MRKKLKISTTQANEEILRFIGGDPDFFTGQYLDSKSPLREYIDRRMKSEGLEFHKSLDWMFPVLEIIGQIEVPGHTYTYLWHFSKQTTWICGGNDLFITSPGESLTHKMALYTTIVKFVFWWKYREAYDVIIK